MTAVLLLGKLVETERKSNRMTASELAERLGVHRDTLQRLERGDPKVELGTAFEACAILGIPLFEEDPAALSARLSDTEKRRALLPKRIRTSTRAISDDF